MSSMNSITWKSLRERERERRINSIGESSTKNFDWQDDIYQIGKSVTMSHSLWFNSVLPWKPLIWLFSVIHCSRNETVDTRKHPFQTCHRFEAEDPCHNQVKTWQEPLGPFLTLSRSQPENRRNPSLSLKPYLCHSGISYIAVLIKQVAQKSLFTFLSSWNSSTNERNPSLSLKQTEYTTGWRKEREQRWIQRLASKPCQHFTTVSFFSLFWSSVVLTLELLLTLLSKLFSFENYWPKTDDPEEWNKTEWFSAYATKPIVKKVYPKQQHSLGLNYAFQCNIPQNAPS